MCFWHDKTYVGSIVDKELNLVGEYLKGAGVSLNMEFLESDYKIN